MEVTVLDEDVVPAKVHLNVRGMPRAQKPTGKSDTGCNDALMEVFVHAFIKASCIADSRPVL